MVDISNLKINERANVERLNLRVTTIENEIYIKGQYENLLILKFANFWKFDNFKN